MRLLNSVCKVLSSNYAGVPVHIEEVPKGFTLIVKGKRTYASVPAVLKEEVKAILIELELPELVTE